MSPIKNLDKGPTRESRRRTNTKSITEPSHTENKEFKLKMQQEFMNEIIANKKDGNI